MERNSAAWDRVVCPQTVDSMGELYRFCQENMEYFSEMVKVPAIELDASQLRVSALYGSPERPDLSTSKPCVPRPRGCKFPRRLLHVYSARLRSAEESKPAKFYYKIADCCKLPQESCFFFILGSMILFTARTFVYWKASWYEPPCFQASSIYAFPFLLSSSSSSAWISASISAPRLGLLPCILAGNVGSFFNAFVSSLSLSDSFSRCKELAMFFKENYTHSPHLKRILLPSLHELFCLQLIFGPLFDDHKCLSC
jgi:hypothetical protein